MTKDTIFMIGSALLPIIVISALLLPERLLTWYRKRRTNWMTENEFLNDMLTISRGTSFRQSLLFLYESMRTVKVTVRNEQNGVPKHRVKDAAAEMIYTDIQYLQRHSGLSFEVASNIAVRRFDLLKKILGGKNA